MAEKYIRAGNGSYTIVKNSINCGRFDTLEDAVFFRDELVSLNWDMSSVKQLYKADDTYLVVNADEKISIVARYKRKPSQDKIDSLIKKHRRNPNNSKYGLNISRIFDTFVIKKRIAGDDYIFGYYDDLKDAEFVRNFLLDNDWNVSAFGQIEFDDETGTYKVLEIIDDRVYVLGSFNSSNIDVRKVRSEFLNKISKHKYGLAMHSHLDELTDILPDLEEKFNIKAEDDVWSFNESKDPLNDIIFTLTPFQKSVYDAIDNSTFEEIKKSLIRFKSGNFDEKIQKNLDELIKSDLIIKNGDVYTKR